VYAKYYSSASLTLAFRYLKKSPWFFIIQLRAKSKISKEK